MDARDDVRLDTVRNRGVWRCDIPSAGLRAALVFLGRSSGEGDDMYALEYDDGMRRFLRTASLRVRGAKYRGTYD